ncbi:MAG: hypothetical protein U1E47_01830 [Rivihabitans pingtungensis]
MMGSRDRELAILQASCSGAARAPTAKVIDLKWMNEDARYARHVLDLAAHHDEDDIRELGRKIAQHRAICRPAPREQSGRRYRPRRATVICGAGGRWWRALQLQRGWRSTRFAYSAVRRHVSKRHLMAR